jgi:rifampicin phosphotransferase
LKSNGTFDQGLIAARQFSRYRPRDVTPCFQEAHSVRDNCVLDVVHATDPRLCGGKASGLARLERAGFSVPPAICLTTEFYQRWLAVSGIAARLGELNRDSVTRSPAARRGMLREIRLRAETSTMPADLAVALHEGVADLRAGWDGGLAVRSSGVFEDDTDASHAGIHASFVVTKVDAASIIAAVKRCWASLWTEPAWTYRDRLGISHAQAAMAVVVQRFISADCAGVAFSVDPLAGDHATVVIEAGVGAGEPLVSGKMTPEQYRITVERGVPVRVHQNGGRHENETRQNGGPRTPVLTESQALHLARLVKVVERTFGMAVDIEWVFKTGVFWAVQVRPITGFGAGRGDLPDPSQTRWVSAPFGKR